MRVATWLLSFAAAVVASSPSTAGIEALVQRRLPQHVHSFEFSIANATSAGESDSYTVSTAQSGKVKVEGNSLSALATGLHRYLTDVAHVDLYWYIGNRLDLASDPLPQLSTPLTGSSIVPYRYHFNTVTTSYTSAFWTWEDWELQLDWMALRGINLPLAWIGFEKIFVQVFQEIGLTDDEILDFLSGPPFEAWNHLGNIQGSWNGSLPLSWVDSQFELQKKIIQRMVDLGMTPILPAFPGFVPRAISRVFPEANVVNGSAWETFPAQYTNDTFLDPLDPRFTQLQKSFISKQTAAYGNVTKFYTLDQFNENNPSSSDPDYLRNVSRGNWDALKAADSSAVWVMQGWLFASNSEFWTNDRIEAYLSGVPVDSDMLILDLVSESQPQWQRTNSYYGKPWIWCELHGYGGNMGFYGQVMNITANPIAALHNSSSLVGFGLSMEGQEGNEVVYDLLLDQAWSETPIETDSYFRNWVTARYAGSKSIPDCVYSAWDTLRGTVYNNTNLTSNAVSKSILELVPSTSGLLNRTGHHPTTINYNPDDMLRAWDLFYGAAFQEPSLWANPAYDYDLVDMSRQVLANAFNPIYQDLISAYNTTTSPSSGSQRVLKIRATGKKLINLLWSLDSVLQTNAHFRLSTWTSAARASAAGQENLEAFFEYEARNQITLWGPTGQISDYASKSWSGLVSSYYIPRWQRFVDYLAKTSPADYDQTDFNAELLEWEIEWQNDTSSFAVSDDEIRIQDVLPKVIQDWEEIFSLCCVLFLKRGATTSLRSTPLDISNSIPDTTNSSMTHDIDIEKHHYNTEPNYAYYSYKQQADQSFSKQLRRVAVVFIISFFFAALSLAEIIKMTTDSVHSEDAVLKSPSYIRYSTVKGYFLQDEESTDPKKFDYVSSNFGLINRTYDAIDAESEKEKTQWERFELQVHALNAQAGPDVQYKVLYMGRHGEGFHNVAEAWYGTDSWDCYWSLLDGNETSSWDDARLTEVGKSQAQTAHNAWRKQIENKVPFPESFYVSPLNRCLQTAFITFDGLDKEIVRPFRPVVKEMVRETIGIHTCDRRSAKSAITSEYPEYIIEPGFAETDPLWDAQLRESDSARDARLKQFLDDFFAHDPNQFVSFTAHSGAITSVLEVVGHRRFGLQTGGVIPVLVRAERVAGREPEREIEPPTRAPKCKEDPVRGGQVTLGGHV